MRSRSPTWHFETKSRSASRKRSIDCSRRVLAIAGTRWAKNVSLLSANFSKIVKDMIMKLSHIKENCLTNYILPNLWTIFNQSDVVINISKMGYMRLLYLRMCSKCRHHYALGTSNALQEAGAHPLRGVCWHFTYVLLDTERQFLLVT